MFTHEEQARPQDLSRPAVERLREEYACIREQRVATPAVGRQEKNSAHGDGGHRGL